MNWSTKTPTDVGWYWFQAAGTTPCVVPIERNQDGKLNVIIPIDGKVMEYSLEGGPLPFSDLQWSDENVPWPEYEPLIPPVIG